MVDQGHTEQPHRTTSVSAGQHHKSAGHGRINQVTVGGRPVNVDGALPGVPKTFAIDFLSMITGSYHDVLVDFVVPVSGAPGPEDDYGVHMRLDGLSWKLGGLDLPAPMVAEIARAIMAGQKPASP